LTAGAGGLKLFADSRGNALIFGTGWPAAGVAWSTFVRRGFGRSGCSILIMRTGGMKEKFRELRDMLAKKDWDGIFRRPTGNIVIQFVRNPLAGQAAFFIDYVMLFVLTELGLHYLVSAGIAFIAGSTANYFLCKKIVFNAYVPRYGNMSEYAFFVIIGVIGLGLTELLMWLFTGIIGTHYMLSKIVSAAVVSLWNFFGRRFLLFNDYDAR